MKKKIENDRNWKISFSSFSAHLRRSSSRYKPSTTNGTQFYTETTNCVHDNDFDKCGKCIRNAILHTRTHRQTHTCMRCIPQAHLVRKEWNYCCCHYYYGFAIRLHSLYCSICWRSLPACLPHRFNKNVFFYMIYDERMRLHGTCANNNNNNNNNSDFFLYS